MLQVRQEMIGFFAMRSHDMCVSRWRVHVLDTMLDCLPFCQQG